MDTNNVTLQDPSIECFKFPEGVESSAREGVAEVANVSAIIGVVSHLFTFKENRNAPGRLLEQSIVIDRPSNAYHFLCMSGLSGAFMTGDLRGIIERPLGQFFTQVGLRGNNLVCTVRLTDSNSDDPIYIQVTASAVFFR